MEPSDLSNKVIPIIITIRNQRVILDADLARVYGVETKRLNEQVKRNAIRFPPDFMFRLDAKEVEGLALQTKPAKATNWSQNATSSNKHRGRVYRPYAFTEHGAIMAATILNSSRAVEMSLK